LANSIVIFNHWNVEIGELTLINAPT